MVEVNLCIKKSIEQNAAVYYEKTKKAKKKLEGAKKALEITKKKLADAQSKKEQVLKNMDHKVTKPKKKQWFERFRWFRSSEGFLCIGGRDATSNDIIIKKHTDKADVVFHTKIEGSPFFVVKTEGKKPGKATLEEAAQATAAYSRGWRLGLAGIDVFYVNPDQLSKKAVEGGNLPKGSYAIIGKMNFVYAKMELAIGVKADKVIGGPVNAIKSNADNYMVIVQGKDKTSAVAKQVQKKIGGNLDDIVSFVPAGGAKVKG